MVPSSLQTIHSAHSESGQEMDLEEVVAGDHVDLGSDKDEVVAAAAQACLAAVVTLEGVEVDIDFWNPLQFSVKPEH